MRKLGALFAVAGVLAAAGCGGGSTPPRTQNPPPAAATLIITPSSATLALGTGRTFSVSASSGTTPPVVWSVSGVAGGNATVGTITDKGFYTAPDTFPADNTVTITAAAASNASQKGNANVTIVFPLTNARPETAPVKLGTSGGNNTDLNASMCCSGTLGSLVRRDGELFILSNNHVIAKSDKGENGDPIGQPGLADTNCEPANVVAHLSQKAPLKTSNVDAAIAKIAAGQVDTNGTILDLGPAGSTSIADAPPSATLADPATVFAANGRVAKSGRSSGLTCSTLQSINTSVSVDYEESCGGARAFTVTFTDQLVVAGGAFSMGGDSGALIVTADNARPLGLLYAGSDTNTVGNPIADVLTALENSTTKSNPTVVGGGDHAVSCAPTATTESAQASPSADSAALSESEMRRATRVKEKFALSLMADPAIQGVGVGRSDDQPGEAAITLYVNGTPLQPLPRQLEGVRTKVIATTPFTARAGEAAGSGEAAGALKREELHRGLEVKERRASGLLTQPGILGVGVGRSDDAPGESALIIYVERGKQRTAVPAVIDGVRTRTIAGQRFRAFGWNEVAKPRACKAPPAKAAVPRVSAR